VMELFDSWIFGKYCPFSCNKVGVYTDSGLQNAIPTKIFING